MCDHERSQCAIIRGPNVRSSKVPMCDHRRSPSVYVTTNLHCERHGVGPSNRGHGGSPPGAVKLRSSRLSQLARCRCGVAGDRTATVCNASSILTQPLRDTRRPARNGCNVSRAWGGGEDTRPPARSNFLPTHLVPFSFTGESGLASAALRSASRS